jgi:transposase-like protein
MENKQICPNCKSQEIVKRGFFQTEAHGKRQRFYCKACRSKFIEQDAFYRMRNSPQKITLCLDLFYKGISIRQIQAHLQSFYPHNSSWVSIYKWVVKYARQISNFTDKLDIKTGEEVQTDEMEYKQRGKPSWFIDAIDTKTRYMLASNYAKVRTQKELMNVLVKIRNKTEYQLKTITTDGWKAYEKAIRKVYGYNRFTGKNIIEHKIVNASQGEGFNHKIERLHNSIRQRTKTFRGFHGSFNSARAIMKGYEVYYNFIRQHQALNGKTPSELATDLRLNSGNKWLELINLSMLNF